MFVFVGLGRSGVGLGKSSISGIDSTNLAEKVIKKFVNSVVC
jgi:hypothetical protein